MLVGMNQNPPKVTLQFQNGHNQTLQSDTLTLTSNQSFNGTLYKGEEVYYAFEKEDWQNKKITISIDEEGWYSLFDDNDQYLGYALYSGKEMLFGFDKRIYHQENNHYLFKELPKLFIYSQEPLDLEGFSYQNGLYMSQTAIDQLTLNDENYLFLVDQKEPLITVDAYSLEQDTYLVAPQKEVTITKQDDTFAYFSAPPGWTKISEDCFETKLTLPIEENIFQDFAGRGNGNVKFVLDEQAPSATFIEQKGQLAINIADEYLDNNSLLDISLLHNDKVIPLTIVDNLLYAPLYQDGHYHWQGTVKDLAGNETLIDKWVTVDQKAPGIYLDDVINEVALSPFTIHLTIYDEFIQSYQAKLYREEQLLQEFSGNQNTSLTIDLDDSDYDDGGGKYYLMVEASDTIQTQQQVFQWRMDMGCSPIILSFNDVRGDAVQEIALHQPLDIKARCLESSVAYQVLQNQEVIYEGQDDLLLQPQWQATSVVFMAEDAFGHKQQRQIIIETSDEQIVPTLFDDTHNEDTSKKETTIVDQPLKDQHISPIISQEKQSYLPFWIGGGIFAFSLMRLIYVIYVRSSTATTNDVEDNAATVVISDKTTD